MRIGLCCQFASKYILSKQIKLKVPELLLQTFSHKYIYKHAYYDFFFHFHWLLFWINQWNSSESRWHFANLKVRQVHWIRRECNISFGTDCLLFCNKIQISFSVNMPLSIYIFINKWHKLFINVFRGDKSPFSISRKCDVFPLNINIQ